MRFVRDAYTRRNSKLNETTKSVDLDDKRNGVDAHAHPYRHNHREKKKGSQPADIFNVTIRLEPLAFSRRSTFNI